MRMDDGLDQQGEWTGYYRILWWNLGYWPLSKQIPVILPVEPGPAGFILEV
jgi:hypothetical protein